MRSALMGRHPCRVVVPLRYVLGISVGFGRFLGLSKWLKRVPKEGFIKCKHWLTSQARKSSLDFRHSFCWPGGVKAAEPRTGRKLGCWE